MTCVQLKKELSSRGLRQSGSKEEMIARLSEAPETATADEALAGEAPLDAEPPMDYEEPLDAEPPMDYEEAEALELEPTSVVQDLVEAATRAEDASQPQEASQVFDWLTDDDYSPDKAEYQVIEFGKHRGETYADAIAEDEAYCAWILQQYHFRKEHTPALREFAEVIMAKKPDLEYAIVMFGKYKGKAMEVVAQEDPDYCSWVLSIDDEAVSSVLSFAEFLRQEHPDIKPSDRSRTVGFGKYRGQPFEEIIETDPDYCRWVAEASDAEDAGGSLKAFGQFIKQNAPDVLFDE